MSQTHRPPPPTPRLPRLLQTAGFMFGGVRFLEACRRRYGGAVTLGTVFDHGFVMVFEPELVKAVFHGPHGQLHAGKANVLLGPILGGRSVLLLDGDEHLHHRRLLLSPFHGRQLSAQIETMRACTDAEIDAWPVGEPFPLLPSLQSLTLNVMLRAVFGAENPGLADELHKRVRGMVDPIARPQGMVVIGAVMRGSRRRAAAAFAARKRAIDELLYPEIARRRADPDLERRDDVFSGLLLARDEQGNGLSDLEVRDELLTLLMAGHETTATALAWTFDLLLHDARVLERARAREEAYLDAIAKEALRIRTVIPSVGRVVQDRPFALGGYEIPAGMEINPSIQTMHMRADLYPEPKAFKPERFLGPDAPDTYTWLPFGGGTRRCLGASFAMTEMRVVLDRVLERTGLAAVDPRTSKVQFRVITLAPKTGVRVAQARPPLAAAARTGASRPPGQRLHDELAAARGAERR
ncbi:MAG: cytochrome P450 [Solirubrobacteraceae bacterium]